MYNYTEMCVCVVYVDRVCVCVDHVVWNRGFRRGERRVMWIGDGGMRDVRTYVGWICE